MSEKIGRLTVVHSTRRFGANSLRSRDGGDPRSELVSFDPNDNVVVIEEAEYESMKERLKRHEERIRRMVEMIDSPD